MVIGRGINVIDNKSQNPSVPQTNIGIQHEFTNDYVVRADYLHNFGTHFIIGRTIGQVFNPVIGGVDLVKNIEVADASRAVDGSPNQPSSPDASSPLHSSSALALLRKTREALSRPDITCAERNSPHTPLETRLRHGLAAPFHKEMPRPWPRHFASLTSVIRLT